MQFSTQQPLCYASDNSSLNAPDIQGPWQLLIYVVKPPHLSVYMLGVQAMDMHCSFQCVELALGRFAIGHRQIQRHTHKPGTYNT